MKKLLLPLIAAVVLFAGCSEKARVITSYYTVNSTQWSAAITTYPDGTYTTDYYYSEWENIDITPDVIDNGVVLVYYIDENGRDNILPYTEYHYYYNDLGNVIYYQERLEYDLETGKITFKIKDSDFNTAESIDNIGQKKFKVSVIRNM